ncbi:unnamed protein product [Boreogadus saida]
MSNPTHDPFYSSPFGPFYRRHSPYMVQPEYRIYEMNKRLQARTEVSAVRGRAAGGSGWSGGEVPVELRFGSGRVTGELCEALGSVELNDGVCEVITLSCSVSGSGLHS